MKSSISDPKVLLPFVFFLLAASHTTAQQPISLQAALDTALSRSYSVQAAKLRTLAAQKAEGTAVDLPPTAAMFEYGSINSAYSDTRVGLSQTFSFPAVYRRQRQWLQAQTAVFAFGEQEVRWQLRKEVTTLYHQLLLLQERRELLLRSDSLFKSFLERQERRFAVGDINVLDKTTAETQRMQIAAQLDWLEADRATVQTRFSNLVNAGTLYTPVTGSAKVTLTVLPDISLLANHPALRSWRQEQQVALSNIEVQKAKLLPQLSLGYVNQSIRGVQNINGVDKFYSGSTRFSSVMAGLNIPLFKQAQKARIAASQIQYEAAGADYNEAFRQQKAVLEALLHQYRKLDMQLRYYDQHALRQARLLREGANLKLSSGEISHIEWILLVNQAVQLEADRFTVLQEWNNTVIELNAYSNF